MPRIRSVHPDMCVSETMAELAPQLERTFVRLWTHCDDEGRAQDNTRLIKAAIYPLHDSQTHEVIDQELTNLAEAGLIVRYMVDGKRFLQIASWDEYQHPQKARPSKFPGPEQGEVVAPPEPLPLEYANATLPIREESGPGGEREGSRRGRGVSAQAPQKPDLVSTKQDPYFDAVEAVFQIPRPHDQESLLGAIAAKCRKGGHPPEEIQERAIAHVATFDFPMTPASLKKRWDQLGSKAVTLTKAQRRQFEAELERRQRRQLLAGGDG